MTIQRIQLRRIKGWRMPPNTVKVDRSTMWGNPWTIAKAREVGFFGTDAELRAATVGMFRNGCARCLPVVAEIMARVNELRGKNLACWCPLNQPCHADVLLELANEAAP
jgi:hypothetical protein